MLDQFREEVVTRRTRTMENLMMVFANIIMVVAFCDLRHVYAADPDDADFNTWPAGWHDCQHPDHLVLCSLCCASVSVSRQDPHEYEYTFTNGIMDFAQVFNNRKRKPLGTMNIRNVEACGMVSSGSFRRYLNTPGVVRLNWF